MRISVIFLAIGIVFFLACESQSTDKETNSSEITKVERAPKLMVPIYDNFDDMEYIFNQENDTTYIINFWATWCKPCVKELPYFDNLYDDYKDDKVKIILVSLDFPKQIESKLYPFIKKNDLKPDVMVLTDGDANTWVSKVDSQWDGAIPVTLVYNKNERDFVYGDVSNYEELKSRVAPLVN